MMRAADFFQGHAFVSTTAPGRINLLGEHTDYNDGFMLPIATPQGTTVSVSATVEPGFRLYSTTLDQTVTFDENQAAPDGFGRYVEGCIRILRERYKVPTLAVHVDSNLPLGTGLSSSAALEVATLRAIRKLLKLDLDDTTLALLAQRAEIEYAGVNCGVMDQMASSLADRNHMLFLDARTLSTRLLAFPLGCELIAIDSGVPPTLAGSKYNERRAECTQAATLLGVTALRDVDDPAAVEQLPEPLRRRARHVVTENLRVLEACEGVSAARFGELMCKSHVSLRDDYQVSVPALDTLCAMLNASKDVHGARLTGAGFGGACIALCREGAGRRVGQAVVDTFNSCGWNASLLLPLSRHATLEIDHEL